ncbi:hypothetical protein KAH94_04580 [bacterium]|nr:hypothetical protein [bacterium]
MKKSNYIIALILLIISFSSQSVWIHIWNNTDSKIEVEYSIKSFLYLYKNPEWPNVKGIINPKKGITFHFQYEPIDLQISSHDKKILGRGRINIFNGNLHNKYIEIQKAKNGKLKYRWYFGFSKGKWTGM